MAPMAAGGSWAVKAEHGLISVIGRSGAQSPLQHLASVECTPSERGHIACRVVGIHAIFLKFSAE